LIINLFFTQLIFAHSLLELQIAAHVEESSGKKKAASFYNNKKNG
jgi:hypothetical protein